MDEPSQGRPQTAPSSTPLDQCIHCGARNPAAAGGGTLHLISTTDLVAVELLLRGALDVVSCAACDAPLTVTTTLAVASPVGKAAVVRLSNLAAPELHIVEDLRQDMAGQGIDLAQVASADEARAWLLGRWNLRLSGPVPTAFSSHEQRRELIDNDPEAFDPETLIGAALIAAYRVEGAPFTLPPKADPSDAVDVIVEIQAQTLLAVMHRWLTTPTRSVERDLRRHAPSGGMLPGTPERVCSALSELLADETISFRLRYLAHALVASVCAAAGRTNTEATNWAATWLGLELALGGVTADSEVDGQPNSEAPFGDADVARATRIDDERAAWTLTREGLHDAIVAQFRIDPTFGVWDPALEAAARAGFPDIGHDLYAALWSDPFVSLSAEQVVDALRRSAAGQDPGVVVLTLDRMVRTHIHQLERARFGPWPTSSAAGGPAPSPSSTPKCGPPQP